MSRPSHHTEPLSGKRHHCPCGIAAPLLFEGLTWREFKGIEQLLECSSYRLSLLDGVLEIRRRPGEPHNYEKVATSEEVSGIDLTLLLRCINMANHVEAIKTFQRSLRP